jgi:hypothetical protein
MDDSDSYDDEEDMENQEIPNDKRSVEQVEEDDLDEDENEDLPSDSEFNREAAQRK